MTPEEIAAEKAKAIKEIKEQAEDAAQRYVAKNLSELLQTEVNSEESKKLIKSIADEAFKSMEIEEKDTDGTVKKTAINQIFIEMQKQHDELSKKVKGITDQKKDAPETWEQQTRPQLEKVKTQLVDMYKNKSVTATLEMKTAGTMTIAGNYSGGIVGLSGWDPEFARIQRRRPFLREIIRVVPTSNQYISWAEQANPDPGSASNVAEGAAKPQSDFDIVERNMQIRKVATFIKVSKEMLADIPYIAGEINTELRELVELQFDAQLLSGTGVDPQLKGILQYAASFSVASTLLETPMANWFDVAVAAQAQIAYANFYADTILVNPATLAQMMLTKDTLGQLIYPWYITNGILNINGMTVVANNGVTVGSFVVMDAKRSTLALREDFNIQIGYVNDDFTKNLVTILAEMRGAHYIKTNYANAFVQGTFEAARWALMGTT